jgi:CheY-like chemotaxis protein
MMKKKRILIADDDPDLVRMVSLELRDCGYEVFTANSGVDAVNKVYDAHPDLVILDYEMPNGDGIYVMTKLRSVLETFTIPIIMLTAYDSKDIRGQAFRLSANYFLSKPFKPSDLLQKVKEVITSVSVASA